MADVWCTKMDSFTKFLLTISFLLAYAVVNSFGQLLVLKNLQESETVDLTCISKDDNAALIWNLAPDDSSVMRNFTPLAPPLNNASTCGVWEGSSTCLKAWEKKDSWELVNTTIKPMGPAFDYRWEGFKEYVLNTTAAAPEYLGMISESAGSLVFSARGNDLHVLLCDSGTSEDTSCVWISLTGSESGSSTIKYCDRGKPGLVEPKECDPIGSKNGGEAVINLHEWRTFIVKWAEKTIKVYKADEIEHFLDGTIPQTLGEVHVFVSSNGYSRIRFHFYDFHTTEKNNAVISTGEFLVTGKFCVELLLGLCSSCKLDVSLMDLQSHLETWTISSSENATFNGLLTWRSLRLERNLSGTINAQVTVKTVLDEDEDRGQWAIGNFRTCTYLVLDIDDEIHFWLRLYSLYTLKEISKYHFSADKIRTSTITIRRDNQPGIKCQKLSYNKPELVGTEQMAENRDSDKFEIYVREIVEQSGKLLKLFGQHHSVCDDKGCLCARGFSGANCDSTCANGSYGYNCADICPSCRSINPKKQPCDKKTGHCTNGCEISKLVPPKCKEGISGPIVTEITDTTVKLNQIVKFENLLNVSFVITKVTHNGRSLSEKILQPNSMANDYELEYKNLTSNTNYKVHARVVIEQEDRSPAVINSSGTFFVTTCNGKARFKVLTTERNLTINKLQRDKVCGDPDHWPNTSYVLVVKGSTGVNDGAKTFPFTLKNLNPYDEFLINIYQKIETKPPIFSTRVRTKESEPNAPRDFMATPKRRGFVELTWKPPIDPQAAVRKFAIIVNLNDTRLLDPPEERKWEFNHTVSETLSKYRHMLSLPPASDYSIVVYAITENNVTSKRATTTVTVPPRPGFDEKEKYQLTQSGTIINTKYPRVVNATNNTEVTISVKGYAMCYEMDKGTGLEDWEAAKYNVQDSLEAILRIGTNQTTSRNCSLYIGIEYTITATAEDSGVMRNTTLGKITLKTFNFWYLACLMVPILITCLYLILRSHRKNYSRRSCHDILPMTMMNTGTSSPPPSVSVTAAESETETETENPIYESVPDVVQNNLYSNLVKVEDFEEYTKEAMASGLLHSQHAVFPIGPTKPCKYGKLTKHLTKNRFPNVIPYDESRVVLKKLPGDSQSDYINASYIHGYHKTRAYIASQGPDANTVKDFWRMIWQEKVRVICMVSNVMESGKAACEQYWPEVKATVKYGDIQITNTNHQVFADYTVRTLNLSRGSDWRAVIQLHYTGWPDIGVPMHTQSLVAYMKKLLAIPAGKGPIVVHCSSGVGRTGTIILCDYCLRQAVKDKVIDVPSVCIKLCEDRVDLIGDVQLYLLAHVTIVEAMVAAQTQIPCNSGLPDKIKELKKQLPSDVRRLKGIVWQDRALHSLATNRGSILNNATGHRPTSAEFVPEIPVVPQFHRDSTFDSESNYINAVSVDGVMKRKQYLESHLPSDDNLCEYWRLIAEKRIELVVILQLPSPNDSSRCGIMPSDSTLIPVPYIRVEIASKPEESEHYITEKLTMTDKSGKKRKQQVTVITCTGWGRGEGGKPPAPAALVAIWRATEKIKRKEGPTLVLCDDGVTGCGLYLALSFLLERMSVETECDVISAVRAVRRSRTEFVQSMAQFEYLYDAAVNYYECFQTYANFA